MSVAGAARFLGVHPNTIRAWSDEGRIAFYRINSRGDRRYRLADLRSAMKSGAGVPTPRPGATAERPTRRTRPAPGARPGRRRRSAASELETPAPAGIPADLVARRGVALAVVGQIARLIATRDRLDDALRAVAWTLRERLDYRAVGFYELRGGSAVALRVDGEAEDASPWIGEVVASLVADGSQAPRVVPWGDTAASAPTGPSGRASAAGELIVVPLTAEGRPWGALVVRQASDRVEPEELSLLGTIADQVALAIDRVRLGERAARQMAFARAVRRIANDIEAQVDPIVVMDELLDLARDLVASNRASIFLRRGDQALPAAAERHDGSVPGPEWPDVAESALAAAAVRDRRPIAAIAGDDGPGGALIPSDARASGVSTALVAPLFDDDGALGILVLLHGAVHVYDAVELEMVAALAAQVGVALRNAREFARTAAWAAQLQSIQQLGARLSRFTAVGEIGEAITGELGLIIQNHNVRVYRVSGDVLEPVAMRGHVGAYSDETAEQLRLRVGEGITGWVAEHGVAQNLPNAALDPRAATVPGTESDLDESMLLAPMLYEDRVLGVIVLSRLGLDQFSDDDLRILVIYASFAAQAIANADAMERLAAQSARISRQLQSQRELLGVTDSILSTLDPSTVIEQIADRLATLVAYDNLVVERLDQQNGSLRPLIARGPHAELFMSRPLPREGTLAGWVLEHGEGQLVHDELSDGRVRQFDELGPVAGSLIEVPLLGPAGPGGVLMLERLGEANRFTDEEFELVRLFAAQAAIALQNAETHREVEIRAETDPLTGLLNHGTFFERLEQVVGRGETFSLLMLDLDDFGRYNNALGHQAGDFLLRAIARRLQRAVRESDAVFRYGGDEFTAILPGTDISGAMAVARKVRDAVRSVSRSDLEQRVGEPVTCSVGFATFPSDGVDRASLLLAADRACFVAKRGGRARIATAAEGLALAGTFDLTTPTPVDPLDDLLPA